jgi:hypothetical protein
MGHCFLRTRLELAREVLLVNVASAKRRFVVAFVNSRNWRQFMQKKSLIDKRSSKKAVRTVKAKRNEALKAQATGVKTLRSVTLPNHNQTLLRAGR